MPCYGLMKVFHVGKEEDGWLICSHHILSSTRVSDFACHGMHALSLFQSSPTPLQLPSPDLHPSTPTPMYTCMPALCTLSQTITGQLCAAPEEAPMLWDQKVVPLLYLSDPHWK